MREGGLILGIDEAGRGPVLGSMVVAGVLATAEQIKKFETIGVRDSKKLSFKKRATLFEKIRTIARRVEIIEVAPAELDARNLNEITFEAAVRLIITLAPDKVIIDAPVSGRGLEEYGARLKEAGGFGALEVVAKNKADVTEPVVSAASIVAKVSRDKLIKKLAQNYAEFGALGSGYPSDPVTKTFLNRYYKRRQSWPKEARLKWRTLETIKPPAPVFGYWLVSYFKRYALAPLIVLALYGVFWALSASWPSASLTQAQISNVAPASSKSQKALVTKVIDGDTLTIQGGEQVRLLGVDTPELDEPCFTEAKKFLEKQVLNKEIELIGDVRDKDKYGRLLRFVMLDNKNINLAIIKAGLAVAYFFDDRLYKTEIRQAEAEAIKNKTGCRWRNAF